MPPTLAENVFETCKSASQTAAKKASSKGKAGQAALLDLEAAAMTDINASDMRVRQFPMCLTDHNVPGGQEIPVFKNYEAHVYVGLGIKDDRDPAAMKAGVYTFNSKLSLETK